MHIKPKVPVTNNSPFVGRRCDLAVWNGIDEILEELLAADHCACDWLDIIPGATKAYDTEKGDRMILLNRTNKSTRDWMIK